MNATIGSSLSLFFFFFPLRGETWGQWTHHWRAVSEQQQEQQRVQDHGQRPHSVPFCCSVASFFLFSSSSSASGRKQQILTQVFFSFFLFLCPAGSRHLVHYALVKNRGFLGGRRGAHPSTRPRYARHVGSGEKPRHCEKGGKKFAGTHAAKNPRRRQGFGEPCPSSSPSFFTDVTSPSCPPHPLVMNPACCECGLEEEPPTAVRGQKLQLAVFSRKQQTEARESRAARRGCVFWVYFFAAGVHAHRERASERARERERERERENKTSTSGGLSLFHQLKVHQNMCSSPLNVIWKFIYAKII